MIDTFTHTRDWHASNTIQAQVQNMIETGSV